MVAHDKPIRLILNSLRGRFFYLFTTLVLFLFLHPYFENTKLGELLFILFFMAIPAAGMYAVGYEKRLFYVGLFLGVPTILWCVGLLTGTHIIPANVGKFIAVVFYLYTTLVILTRILSAKKVTSDILYGAVCVYLMLGMTWMLGYRLIDQFYAGSFYMGDGGSAGGLFEVVDLLYFSFVTLTTLGYGDILPLTAQARSLAFLEATCGALYLAILIARLVSLYTAQDDEEELALRAADKERVVSTDKQ
jgi:hypothetical protein